MKYQVDVDNESKVMMVFDKGKLEWLYAGIQGSDEDAKVPMTFLMCELGLLDDKFEPVWR